MAEKYRREGRSATLSHEALLVALVTAAPEVAARLKREAEVRTSLRCNCHHKPSLLLFPDPRS